MGFMCGEETKKSRYIGEEWVCVWRRKNKKEKRKRKKKIETILESEMYG